MVLYKKFRIISFVLVMIVWSLAGCSGVSSYRNVTAEEAKKLMEASPELVIIDVRTPYEYQQGHIKGSLLIPVAELPKHLEKLDPEQKILLVCATGSRSAAAARMLAEKGYKKVYNLSQGLARWPYGLER
ncbi:rhodanese-like domain-containing protein [Calderihabitans maritimus]|uniref:Rhodanese-like domain-containing protein n=1 Tax=Calderihabitans maritimus TaxID=1246530 RepID=A0A1Z5HUL6_9FIRM|nr:rhodanese-like domain-containing protein [Calderihabitans maritimus]GAW93021.1 rhodanese-like domain-containing protein [Calderihabitans maritimus]